MRTRHRRWRTTEAVQERARQLRSEQTPTERRLWARLRQRQVYGLRFRRQHPIGRFIVDFCCISHKLVIEIDGRTHDTQMAYDEARTEWLEGQGYRVIRFTNDQVEREIDGVLAEIARQCDVGE
ncbi:MAG: endonuclease domain-containing protein [Anaerolineae bacterium]|nr:endonuclease domain-containing protein [Anaerolineae bacterium]